MVKPIFYDFGILQPPPIVQSKYQNDNNSDQLLDVP